MSYFDGIEVGDKIWTFEFGECEVVELLQHSIKVHYYSNGKNRYSWYEYDGIMSCTDEKRSQTAFWSKPEIIAPPRPFSLENEIKKLKVKKFCDNECNAYIYVCLRNNIIEYNIDRNIRKLGTIYFEKEGINELVKKCKENKVSANELVEMFDKIFVKSEVRINGN